VGKTELARGLAEFLFDDEDSLIRIDMSEYMERFSSSRLTGAPPGYVGYEEGGQLTEKVRRRPYSVVLFDEIEKAHPDMFNMLLQVLDDGQLTDGLGRKVDFRNTVIIMTSNVGARMIQSDPHVGFKQESTEDVFKRIESDISTELKRTFNPEFLNRVDETVVFHPLEKEHLLDIVGIQLQRLNERVQEQQLELVLDDAVKEWVTEKGYDPAFGARPMRRVIQKYIEAPLSDEILKGSFSSGGRICVYLDDEGKIAFKEAPELAEV